MEFMDRYDEAIEELRKQPDTPLNRLPGFIQDFLQMKDKTDEAQIRVLKEFFERFKIEEVQNRNIIVEGIIENGYVFSPMVRFLHYQFPYAGFFGELRGTYAI